VAERTFKKKVLYNLYSRTAEKGYLLGNSRSERIKREPGSPPDS
jgi:hypothetical protein